MSSRPDGNNSSNEMMTEGLGDINPSRLLYENAEIYGDYNSREFARVSGSEATDHLSARLDSERAGAHVDFDGGSILAQQHQLQQHAIRKKQLLLAMLLQIKQDTHVYKLELDDIEFDAELTACVIDLLQSPRSGREGSDVLDEDESSTALPTNTRTSGGRTRNRSRSLTSWTYLGINYCSGDVYIHAILTVALNLGTIVHFDLRSDSDAIISPTFSTNVAWTLATGLSLGSSIKKLILSYFVNFNSVQGDALNALSAGLQQNTTIEELSLEGCGLSDAQMASIISSLRPQTIPSSLSPTATSETMLAEQPAHAVSSSSSSHQQQQWRYHQLVHLDLNQNVYCGEQVMRELAIVLSSTLCNLKTLNLSNHLSKAQVRNLRRQRVNLLDGDQVDRPHELVHFDQHQHRRHMQLQQRQMGDIENNSEPSDDSNDVQHRERVGGPATDHNFLNSVSISGLEHLSHALRTNTSVQKIDLTGNGLNDRDIISFSDNGLRYNETLEELCLASNNITDRGILALYDALTTRHHSNRMSSSGSSRRRRRPRRFRRRRRNSDGDLLIYEEDDSGEDGVGDDNDGQQPPSRRRRRMSCSSDSEIASSQYVPSPSRETDDEGDGYGTCTSLPTTEKRGLREVVVYNNEYTTVGERLLLRAVIGNKSLSIKAQQFGSLSIRFGDVDNDEEGHHVRRNILGEGSNNQDESGEPGGENVSLLIEYYSCLNSGGWRKAARSFGSLPLGLWPHLLSRSKSVIRFNVDVLYFALHEGHMSFINTREAQHKK